MPVNAKIYQEAADVNSKLIELGLTVDELLDVVRHCALSLASQTSDHPSWGRGITPASEAIFALRSRLKEKGWVAEEERGFALTVHPEDRLAINVAKGDEGTGDPEASVATAAEKGICSVAAINGNQYVLDIPAPESLTRGRPTWYLLVRRFPNCMRAELSLPVGLLDRHISLWRERIMLPQIDDDSIPEPSAGFDDGGFEVPLSRKR